MIVEVCVDSLRSAKSAIEGGAKRLEICGNLGVGGGTTPSAGLVKSIVDHATASSSSTNIAVMIRPRVGDFCYNEDEFVVMLHDIQLFKNAGVHGIVVGVLHADGTIDTGSLKRLVNAALPLEVCFHRAIDLTLDPIQAVRDVRSVDGVSRILTSGHKPRAVDSPGTLREMMVTSNGTISIMPGSGVSSLTAPEIARELPGLQNLHLSGGSWIPGVSKHRPIGFGMGIEGHEWDVWETSTEAVKKVVDITQKLVQD